MNGRSSGILLPVFSLPGPYGVGGEPGKGARPLGLSGPGGPALLADPPLVPPGDADSPYMSPPPSRATPTSSI